MTRFELDEAGIRARGLLGAAIRWEDLCSLRLDYYSTRRDPEGRTMQGGWMQLKLRGSRHTWRTWRTSATLRIDSELEGFADLVRAVAFEARRRGVNFDWATRANLHVLGIDPALAEAA